MQKYPTTQQFGLTIPLKSLAEQRFQSPSVSSFSKDDDKVLMEFLLKIISETYVKCGIKTDGGELSVNTKLFKEELKMFPYITVKELRKAFSDGYKEKYGKYYGLSVKTFVGWLDYYVQNVRNENLNNLKPQTKPKTEISEKEKQRLILQGLKKCFNEYENNQNILDGYLFFLYDIFYEDGFLPKDKESKIKAFNDAKTFFELQLHNKSNSLKEHYKNKEIRQGLAKENSPMIINKAKEMVVLKFLRETYRDNNLVDNLKIKYQIV
jgi:hypothetical protein